MNWGRYKHSVPSNVKYIIGIILFDLYDIPYLETFISQKEKLRLKETN